MNKTDNINLYAINEIERQFKVDVTATVGFCMVSFKVIFPDNEALFLKIPENEIIDVGPLMLTSRIQNAVLDRWLEKIKR